MNVPIDACENGNAAFTLRIGYDGKCYPGNLGTGGGTSPKRRLSWCINSSLRTRSTVNFEQRMEIVGGTPAQSPQSRKTI